VQQVGVYALLWHRDHVRNPLSSRATRLVLAYPSHEELVSAPSVDELDDMERALALRSDRALSELRRSPAPAYPSASTCKWCPVRQLCEPYWEFVRTSYQAAEWGDVEVVILETRGSRAWTGQVIASNIVPPNLSVLVRATDGNHDFQPGGRWRLIDVAFAKEHEDRPATLVIVRSSETFRLKSPSPHSNTGSGDGSRPIG
jgi:hypothetical protein